MEVSGKTEDSISTDTDEAKIYITSTKNSQGLPIAIRKDCRLPATSSACALPVAVGPLATELPCWGGVVVVVATDCSEPLERDLDPPDRRPLP